jgi:DNA-binding NarL/FixJ family response regulator
MYDANAVASVILTAFITILLSPNSFYMYRIKVAIADDHMVFRQGIIGIIGHHTDIQVVCEASHGKELLQQMPVHKPDVILMDIKMPVMDGLQATTALHEQYPSVKVLALSMLDDEAYIIRMLQCGAKGYLLKNAEADEIVEAIRTVYSKNYYFNEQVSVAMLKEILTDERIDLGSDMFPVELTTRERQILELICHEYTNYQIGEELAMSHRTVEGYRMKLMEKTGTKTTVGLVLFAVKNKLIAL